MLRLLEHAVENGQPSVGLATEHLEIILSLPGDAWVLAERLQTNGMYLSAQISSSHFRLHMSAPDFIPYQHVSGVLHASQTNFMPSRTRMEFFICHTSDTKRAEQGQRILPYIWKSYLLLQHRQVLKGLEILGKVAHTAQVPSCAASDGVTETVIIRSGLWRHGGLRGKYRR
jgi:hypothetical protein